MQHAKIGIILYNPPRNPFVIFNPQKYIDGVKTSINLGITVARINRIQRASQAEAEAEAEAEEAI